MDITANTTWTVTKDSQSVELTLEDIEYLLNHLAWSGNLVVFDEHSRRCGSDDEINVSLNGNAIQITLVEEGSEQEAEVDSSDHSESEWRTQGF